MPLPTHSRAIPETGTGTHVRAVALDLAPTIANFACLRRPILVSKAVLTLLAFVLLVASPSIAASADRWPEFRGPRGDGQAIADLPIEFGERTNVTWKTPIHGRGWSSPVVWDDQIWMTTATEDGKRMYGVAVDLESGKIIHDVLVFENEEPRFCHPTNSYASCTPVIEEGRVYLHFGSYGTCCLDTETGEKLWERRDLPCDHFRGPGSSPVLHDGKLYVAFDGYDLQYVAALDAETGQTVWKRDRDIDYGTDNGDLKKAYCTCLVLDFDGRVQVISPSAVETISYDPATGEQLWRVRHGGMNAAARPVFGRGLVFIAAGDGGTSLIAVRPDGSGDVTDSHIAWGHQRGAPKRPSPVIKDEYLFTVNDDGVAACIVAETGEVVWQKRIGGNYRASPILVGDRIYAFDLDGRAPVFTASPEFELLTVNQLENGFQASPAVVGNRLILRTTTDLYCIEK